MSVTNLYLFYDTETTGNVVTQDDVISLGAVLCTYKDKVFHKLEEFHSYVLTDKKIHPAAQAVHHISSNMLQGAPRFPAVVSMFEEFIVRHHHVPSSGVRVNEVNPVRVTFIAHNGAKFDNVILYCNFVQHNLNFDMFLKRVKCHGFMDTIVCLKSIFKTCSAEEKPKDPTTGRESYALGNCFSSFCGGMKIEGAHDALVDSRALVDVFNSKCVSTKLNLNIVYTHVVPKDKSLTAIKRSAGVMFQTKEDNAKHFPSIVGTRPTELTNVPIFRDVDASKPLRLCLNCIHFVQADTHTVCSIVAEPKEKVIEDVEEEEIVFEEPEEELPEVEEEDDEDE